MNDNYVLRCTVNDLSTSYSPIYTEMHANFCEQQITVRKVLVLSDTLDIRTMLHVYFYFYFYFFIYFFFSSKNIIYIDSIQMIKGNDKEKMLQ